MDQAFVRQMNQRLQAELLKKEVEVVQYWRGELDRLLGRRHQDMASLQLDLKALVQKMDNRLKILKSSGSGGPF